MCSGPIVPKLIVYAVPLIISGYLQLLFNAADMAIVGQFGSNGAHSLAAVGATSSLINLVLNVFIGMAVGANAVVARRIGAGDKQGVSRAVHTAVLLGIVSGIIVMIVGLCLAKDLLLLMKTPADLIDLSVLYLRVYFLGAPFLMFYNFGSAILRAVGDTRKPMYFLITSGVLNVILNLIFVIVFHLDVAGVALATVLSQVLSAVLVFISLIRHSGDIKLFPSKIRLHKNEFLQIIQIGIPAGIQSSMFSISNMIVQSSINFFGTATIAACSAASSIEGFVYIGMNCFYQTVLSFVSQNFGRHDFDRIKKIIVRSVLLVVITGLFIGTIVMTFNETLIGLYLPDNAGNKAELLNIALQRNMVVVWPYFLCGIMEVFVGSLRAMGQSLIPMLASMFGVCGGRMLWIFTVFEHFKYGSGVEIFGLNLTPLQILMFAWPVAWIFTSTIHLITLVFELRKHRRKTECINNIKVINSINK